MARLDVLDRAETLVGAVESLVESRRDDEALVLLDRVAGERATTLGELWDHARGVQARLVANDLEPGAVVVLVLPTSPELIGAYFGTVLAGGVPAMLSTPSHRVSDPGIFGARVAHVVENARPHSLIGGADVLPMFEGDGAAVLGSTQLLDVDAIGESGCIAEPFRPSPDSIATIQYSSGTTGAPKGVQVTHAAVLNNLRSMREALEVQESDVSVNWAPLYHDMGLFGCFLLPLLCGCKTVLMPTMDFMRDPASWLRAIDRYRGAISWAPNLAYALCAKRLRDEALEGLDLSSWRLAVNASEPCLTATIEAFAERMAPYGFRRTAMTPAYGLAEGTVMATVQPMDEEPRYEWLDRDALAGEEVARPVERDSGVPCVSVGRAIPGCRLEIRDPEGRALPDRHVGQVWLHSNALFSSYQANAELTSRTLADGWLDTGDRGYLVDGYLFFVARSKDLIVIGGEKYTPQDVEAVIGRAEGVREGCAVAFGVLNVAQGTEELGAVVETRVEGEEALDVLADEIRLHVSRAIGLGLRHLHLVPPGGIEKTTSGKLARGATRDRYPEVFGARDA